jgi:hypothetical protein
MRSPLLASVLALPLALSTAACASSGGLEARSAADADASPEAAAEPQAEVDVAGAAGEGLKTATYTTALLEGDVPDLDDLAEGPRRLPRGAQGSRSPSLRRASE